MRVRERARYPLPQLLEALGADEAVDYSAADFWARVPVPALEPGPDGGPNRRGYSVVLDCVGGDDYWQVRPPDRSARRPGPARPAWSFACGSPGSSAGTALRRPQQTQRLPPLPPPPPPAVATASAAAAAPLTDLLRHRRRRQHGRAGPGLTGPCGCGRGRGVGWRWVGPGCTV